MVPKEAPAREAVRRTLGSDGSETVGGSVCAATEVGDGSGKTSGWLLESEGAGMEGGSSRDGGDWRGGSERQAAGDGIN
jgi:hypothetical protein